MSRLLSRTVIVFQGLVKKQWPLDKFAYYDLVGYKMSMLVFIYPSDNHVLIDDCAKRFPFCSILL